MKVFLKVIFLLGFLFWTSFFVHSVVMLFLYNGLDDHYSFICTNAESFKITEEANCNLKVTYTYSVLQRNYSNEERIARELFYSKIKSKKELPICYNSSYPRVSYINGVNLSVERECVSATISLIFLVFISLIYLFAKREYWINKYKERIKKLSS